MRRRMQRGATTPARGGSAPRCLMRTWLSAAAVLLHVESVLSAAPSAKSVSSVITKLFPPENAYASRRALARDAALASSAVRSAEGIPLAGDESVYGEFDLDLFQRLLELSDPQQSDAFLDVGSGVGRLVLASALLYPSRWSNCQGIELSPPLHALAIEARQAFDAELAWSTLNIAPCEFTCASIFDDLGVAALEAADVVFAYVVTWARDDQERLTELSALFARHLRAGARVICVDVGLRDAPGQPLEGVKFDLLHSVEGANSETGSSRGGVYRVCK